MQAGRAVRRDGTGRVPAAVAVVAGGAVGPVLLVADPFPPERGSQLGWSVTATSCRLPRARRGYQAGMEQPGDVEEADAEGRAAVEPDIRRHNDTQADAPDDGHTSGGGGGVHMSYVRFGAMIATSTVVMFGLMYLHTYTWDHVRWSETRAYMALVMGATMAVIMLGFMLSMYRSTVANIGIVVGAVLLFGGSLWLVRSQVTVQDQSYMRAMIPHHSIAILTSERSELADYRVCELAVEIIEAQRREIAEMDWLIADIAENGPADTSAEAEERAVPDFIGTSKRSCA